MILIPEQALFVLGEGGQRQSYDFAGLCADLRAAFERNGVRDSWLVDQFTLTVEERLRGQSPMTECEIDTLLASVLTASGYGDVASTFTELRGRNPLSALEAELHPWNMERLNAVLRLHLPLSPMQLDMLSKRCAETLAKLHFQDVSDTFIRELGIHLLHGGAVAETSSEKTEQPKDEWLALCDDKTRDMLERHVLSVYPIAPLFPRARIAFDLQMYTQGMPSEWKSELALCSKLSEAAACGLSLLTAIRHTIMAGQTDFRDCPSHVVIPRYQAFLENFEADATLRGRRGFDKRLRKALTANFVGRTDFEVMVSYR